LGGRKEGILFEKGGKLTVWGILTCSEKTETRLSLGSNQGKKGEGAERGGGRTCSQGVKKKKKTQGKISITQIPQKEDELSRKEKDTRLKAGLGNGKIPFHPLKRLSGNQDRKKKIKNVFLKVRGERENRSLSSLKREGGFGRAQKEGKGRWEENRAYYEMSGEREGGFNREFGEEASKPSKVKHIKCNLNTRSRSVLYQSGLERPIGRGRGKKVGAAFFYVGWFGLWGKSGRSRTRWNQKI